MTSEESADLVRLAAASGRVNAVNFNIRFYPLNQHVASMVRDGGVGDVRLVTGRYFQDWLLLRHGLELAPRARARRRAARRGRHRLALARPD